MGQNHSSHFDFAVKATKTGGKRQKGAGIRTIPLDLQALLRAKTMESYSSAFEKGAHGMKHMGDLYTNLKQQPSNAAPNVHVFNSSIAMVFQGKDCIELLKTFLHGTQVVAYLLDVLGRSDLEKIGVRIAGELDAQTGLEVPKKFASHVHSYVETEATRVYVDGLQHLYFLFHPDNNWHPEFRERVKRTPLPDNLVAMSESLDCLVVWMTFIRGYLNRTKPKISKTTMFHIIIPAYETTFIKDPLEFPDVGLLMIQGETRRQRPLVWLNLPTVMDYPEDRLTFKDIGNIARKESSWKDVASVGTGLGVFAAACLLSPACPGLPFAAPVGCAYAAEAVRKRLSKEVPRILGTSNSNHDGPDGHGNSTTDDEGFTFQPGTRHVRRRKRRNGHHEEHRQR